MAFENPNVISELDARYPADTDPVKEGAMHLRALKTVLLAAFGEGADATTPLSWLEKMHTVFSAYDETTGVLTTNAILKTTKKGEDDDELVSLAQAKLAPYPVGTVALFGQEVDPNTALGGKWTELQAGYSLRTAAKGATLGPAGSDNVTLSASNMPAHTHNFSGTTNTTGNHVHNLNGTGSADGASGANSYPADGRDSHESTMTGSRVMSAAGNHNHTISGTTTSVGGGAAFSVAGAVYNLRAWMRTE